MSSDPDQSINVITLTRTSPPFGKRGGIAEILIFIHKEKT